MGSLTSASAPVQGAIHRQLRHPPKPGPAPARPLPPGAARGPRGATEPITRILRRSEARGNTRMVLTTLLLLANGAAIVAASMMDLSLLAAMRPNSTRRGVHELYRLGELQLVEEGRGRGKPNVYRITVPDMPTAS